jgi:hypothetical protein
VCGDKKIHEPRRGEYEVVQESGRKGGLFRDAVLMFTEARAA